MDKVAAEAKKHMGADLKTEHVKLPLLRTHGQNKGRSHHEGAAKAILFHSPENRDKVRSGSFPLFKRGGMVPTAKDARRAVRIAKTYARGGHVMPRLAFASGGTPPPNDWNRPPLMHDEPLTEATLETHEGPSRKWIPQSELEHPALGQNAVVRAQPAAPVLKSKVEDLLQNHDLDTKKVGNNRTPQEWAKALTKYGAKNAEIKAKGLDEGDQKISRQDLLALAKQRRWDVRVPTLRDKPFKEEVQGIDYDPYVEPHLSQYWSNGPDPSRWEASNISDAELERRVEKRLKDEPGIAEHPEMALHYMTDLSPEYGHVPQFQKKWLLSQSTKHRSTVRDNFYYDRNLARPLEHFTDPNKFDKGRLQNFVKEMVAGGYADPAKAVDVLNGAQKGNIDLNDWNAFVKHTGAGLADAMRHGATTRAQNGKRTIQRGRTTRPAGNGDRERALRPLPESSSHTRTRLRACMA